MSRGLKEIEARQDIIIPAKIDNHATKKLRAPSQPLSVFSRTLVVILLGFDSLLAILGTVIHQANIMMTVGVELLIITLILSGVRWAPILGTITGSFVIIVFSFFSDFPLAHLSHPKDVYGPGVLPAIAFLIFCVILLSYWCSAMLVVNGIAAVVHNYTQRQRRTPRWYKMALAWAIGVFFGGFFLGAISQPAPVVANATGNVLHLYVSGFSQPSITINKGSTLTLINDGNYHHSISNGQWVNGQPMITQETGAPKVSHLDINTAGKSYSIGPFATAGTYHLLCSIHHGMMVTIVVQ